MNNVINVTVCNCSNCVLNGAEDIAEAIESLKKLKVQYTMKVSVHIAREHIGVHTDNAPVVKVNNFVIENARPETVMSKVLSVLHGGEN